MEKLATGSADALDLIEPRSAAGLLVKSAMSARIVHIYQEVVAADGAREVDRTDVFNKRRGDTMFHDTCPSPVSQAASRLGVSFPMRRPLLYPGQEVALDLSRLTALT